MLADLKSKEGDLAIAQELYEQAADATENLLTNSPNEEMSGVNYFFPSISSSGAAMDYPGAIHQRVCGCRAERSARRGA